MKKWMLAVCALVSITPAQASCHKSTAELVKFLLPYAASNFAAINGGAASPGSYQYNLTPTAEQFCPHVFIIEDTAARDKYPEFWEVKFSGSENGTGDDVAMSLVKSLSPILKAAGYQDKPYINDGDDPQTYNIEWDGPSDTWVAIETYIDDETPTKVHYGVRVAHNVK